MSHRGHLAVSGKCQTWAFTRYFWPSQLGENLLASSGLRPEMLLNIYNAQDSPTTKNYSVPKVYLVLRLKRPALAFNMKLK